MSLTTPANTYAPAGSAVQSAAEAYIGLVEVGVGLIPAGAGTKEMLARAMDAAPPGADPLPFVARGSARGKRKLACGNTKL